MNKYTTTLLAIDPLDFEVKRWSGPTIDAISFEDAEEQISDRGYLSIVGLLIEEIDEETGEITNYENLN